MNENYVSPSLTFQERTFTATAGSSAERITEDLIKVPDLENSSSNTVKVYQETSLILYSRQRFSLEENITCTYDPSIVFIDYDIALTNGEEVPDWISFNPSTMIYEGRAPTVRNEVVYSFVLKSSWGFSEKESEQIVKITINNNVPITTAGMVASISSTASVAICGLIAMGGSILNGSPLTGFYLILHQLQMVILMLMIDSFIPQGLREYIESQDYVMLNFNFIPVADFPLVDIPLDWMHSEQTSQSFQALGLESKSTLVNNISLFTTLIFFALVHLLFRYVLV